MRITAVAGVQSPYTDTRTPEIFQSNSQILSRKVCTCIACVRTASSLAPSSSIADGGTGAVSVDPPAPACRAKIFSTSSRHDIFLAAPLDYATAAKRERDRAEREGERERRRDGETEKGERGTCLMILNTHSSIGRLGGEFGIIVKSESTRKSPPQLLALSKSGNTVVNINSEQLEYLCGQRAVYPSRSRQSLPRSAITACHFRRLTCSRTSENADA